MLTENQAMKTEVYPLPWFWRAVSTLSGGTWLRKLNLSHMYLQIPLLSNHSPTSYSTCSEAFKGKRVYIWRWISGGHISAGNGNSLTGDTLCLCLWWWHACYRSHWAETPSQLGVSPPVNWVNGHEAEEREVFFLKPEIEYFGHWISKEGLKLTETRLRPSERNLMYAMSQNSSHSSKW